MQDLLSDLTPAQQEAVTHVEGPLLILAAAGSGKTRVITRRVVHLIQSGVRPSNILAITFTNKAAGEMKQRVEHLLPGNRVTMCTFHSLGAKILRTYGDRLGIDRNFTIYDVDDRNKLVREAIAHLNMDEDSYRPERIAHAISGAKNKLLSPAAYAQTVKDYFGEISAQIYTKYEKLLRASNGMDFDDLLYLPAMAMKMNEEFRRDLDYRYQFIMVDEYQDTNKAQYEIARRMSFDHPNLCVVGDPDQSIYKWRGSDIKNIMDFERDFPKCTTIALEKNFRSTPNILKAADTLIDNNKKRKKKALITDNPTGEPVKILTYNNGLDEAEGIILKIKKLVKTEKKHKYSDCAIFLRINALTRSLESAFVQHGVPFQIVKGFAFYERKENKDVLAYLRLIVNPNDSISFMRAVNEPARGVGKTSLEKLKAYAAEREISMLTAASQIAQIAEIKGKAATGIKDFYRLISELRAESADKSPPEIINMVLDKSGYRTFLKKSNEDEDAERLANIEEMITAAEQFHTTDPEKTIADFLEQVALASDIDAMDESSDRVSVMTLHAAKGLEFPVVFMCAVEQGILPHDRSLGDREEIEEERRLCFVGMTRAMKQLYFSHSRSREFRGQILMAIPSMFIGELPNDVVSIDESMSRNVARNAYDDYRNRPRGYDPGTVQRAPSAVKPVTPVSSVSTNLPDGSYAQGQVVQHEQYGIGQISDVSGFGALKKIKIRFPAFGEKTFVADKVKLKVVNKKG